MRRPKKFATSCSPQSKTRAVVPSTWVIGWSRRRRAKRGRPRSGRVRCSNRSGAQAPDPSAMLDILANSLIPVFAGLLVGYVAGVRNVVDNKDLRTLITFVMSFAVPCALFITIVRAPHSLLWGEGRVVLVLAVTYLAIYALTYFSATNLGKLNG